MKKTLTIFFFLISFSSQGGIGRAPAGITQKSALIQNLLKNSLNYSAQEIIRGELKKGKWANNFEYYLDQIIDEIGTEQLDRLSYSKQQIKRSKNIAYLSGKNALRMGKYKNANKLLKKSLKPSSNYYSSQLLMLGSSAMLKGEHKSSSLSFMECENTVKPMLNSEDNLFGQEYQIIHDTCILNQARIDFELGNFLIASKQYEKVKKSSLLWPEILFEEAWASFYRGNYNRTLGKLVTYKSPFFDFIFNPEVEVLEALTYMELCFYENTQKVVNKFYADYGKDAKYLKKFLFRYKNNPLKGGSLLLNVKNRKAIKNPLLRRLLNSINKDLVFRRLINNYDGIKDEVNLVKNYPDKKYIRFLATNLKSSLRRQKYLIGIYGLRILDRANRQLDKSFRGMSYIRLEILKKEKDRFFGQENEAGKIGDLKNVKRTSRHYLWDFNGEFWADELGDYVFSLKSECKV